MSIAANLKHAARNGQTVTIGGGDFCPAELAVAAKTLEGHAKLLEIATRLLTLADLNGVSSLYENRKENPHVTLCGFGQTLRDLRACVQNGGV